MTLRTDSGLMAVIDELARSGAAGFEWYKDSCLVRRIEVRMRARGTGTLLTYAALLRDDPLEVERLLHTISVRVTGFFRNPDSWARLRQVLAAEPVGAASRNTAWSMGCATGEEAWSLALLLHDRASRAETPPSGGIHIVGSDVDPQALVTAQEGRYPAAAVDAIREVLPSYVPPPGELYEVDAMLRPLVSFQREDLTTVSATPGPCELVCCRNLLIFLGPEGQRRVLDAAFRALRPGGLLMLGRTESLMSLSEPRLIPVDIMHRIYRRAS